MHGQSWFVELSRKALIEFLILFRCDVRFVLGPKRAAIADASRLRLRLFDQVDRRGHGAGMFIDDRFDLVRLKIGL